LDDEKHELEEDAKVVERAENAVEMNNTTHQTLDSICDHKLNETNSNEQTKNKDIMENKFDDIVKANLDETDGLDNTNTNLNTNLANTGIDKKRDRMKTNSRTNGSTRPAGSRLTPPIWRSSSNLLAGLEF